MPQRPLPGLHDRIGTPVDHDDTVDSILDAAVAEFMDHGIEGSSIEGVATRLGVDHRAVSRRFDKDGLAKAVMTREAKRYLHNIGQSIGRGGVRERVEEGFVAGVSRRREQYMLDALLKRDPVAAMAYIVGPEAGRLLDYSVKIVRNALRQARPATRPPVWTRRRPP